jgi:hypothetical protein
MKIDMEKRIEYYLGDTEYDNQKPQADNKMFLCNGGNQYKYHYPEDVSRLFKLSKRNELWFKCSDARYVGPNFPIITKTRDTHNPESRGIIGSLEYNRHFHPSMFVHQVDFSWKDKKKETMWRGASTGIEKDNRACSRLDFVKMYFDKLDVGLSQCVGGWGKNNKKVFKKYKKDFVGIQQQLTYKYIPILDGNDKASCLNWVLASNSIPLMPKPRFHSWLCEKFLEPNVHYVQLKDDYSDLIEKLEWCVQNDSACHDMAENGKRFMSENFNTKRETEAEKQLMRQVDSIYENMS